MEAIDYVALVLMVTLIIMRAAVEGKIMRLRMEQQRLKEQLKENQKVFEELSVKKQMAIDRLAKLEELKRLHQQRQNRTTLPCRFASAVRSWTSLRKSNAKRPDRVRLSHRKEYRS